MQQIRKIIFIITFMLLFACDTSEEPAGKDFQTGKLTGVVTDALLINSNITATLWDQETGDCQDDVVASTTTNKLGKYELEITGIGDEYICLHARGGFYVEEASGNKINLEEHHYLSGIISYQHGESIRMSITPATTWAHALVTYNRKNKYQAIDAYSLGKQSITSFVGVGIEEVTPVDTTNPIFASPVVSDSHRYGIFLSAISSLTKTISESQGIEAHTNSSFSSIQFAWLGTRDLLLDGKLDGVGLSRDNQQIKLSMGTYPMSFQVYRNKVAEHILHYARSDKNKTGLSAQDYLSYAQERAGTTAPIFDNAIGHAVDLAGPVITTQIARDYTFNGTVDLTYAIDDLIGVKESTLYIDGVREAGALGGKAVFTIDTTRFNDGAKQIKVVSVDNLDNESEYTHNVNFDNTAVPVNVTSELLVNATAYSLQGSYAKTDNDLAEVVIYWYTNDPLDKDGDNWLTEEEKRTQTQTKHEYKAIIDEENNTWQIDFTLEKAGVNRFKLYSVDEVGNTSEHKEITVNVDKVSPVISFEDVEARYTAEDGNYDSCSSMSLVVDYGISNTYPLCVRGDRLKVDGRSIEASLTDDGFVLLNFTVSDMETEVRTLNNELKVEYRYIKNQDTAKPVVDWRELAKPYNSSHPEYAQRGNEYVIVLASEYLGDNWWQITTSDLLQLEIRVTDSAGNSNSKLVNLKVEIFTLPDTGEIVYAGESLFAGKSFNTRTLVDGQNYEIEYKYKHTGYNAIWLKVNDSSNHTAQLQYEKKWRSNYARLVNAREETYTQQNSRYNVNCYSNWMKPAYGAQLHDHKTTSTSYSSYAWYNYDTSSSAVYSSWQNTRYQSYTNAYRCWWTRDKSWYENHPGYPRNNSSYHWESVVSFNTSNVLVEDKTRGVYISEQHDGWYYIPAYTDIVITKQVTLPVLNHHNDIDILDGGFNSYSARYLDKEIQWYLDTKVELLIHNFYYSEHRDQYGQMIPAVPTDEHANTTKNLGDGRKYHRIYR